MEMFYHAIWVLFTDQGKMPESCLLLARPFEMFRLVTAKRVFFPLLYEDVYSKQKLCSFHGDGAAISCETNKMKRIASTIMFALKSSAWICTKGFEVFTCIIIDS